VTWFVTTSQSAEEDIQDAAEWYEARSGGLGDRLVDDARALQSRMARNPMQFASVYRDARKAALRRFPYLLIFRVFGDEVRIVGCFHNRRDPRRWRSRID